jgi:type IV pilus assembly protein PilQ
MRKAIRRPAMAIVALILAATFGCAARGPGSSPRQTAETANSPAAPTRTPEATPPAGGARVTLAALNEDADGARVVLSADAPLLYTAYEPRPDLLVVDLPGADLASGFMPPAGEGSLVTSIRFDPVLEMGKRLTRVSISHQPGITSDVRSVGQGLAISFEHPAGTAARGEASPEAPAAPAPVVVAEEIARPAAQPPQAGGELAHQLEDLRVSVGTSQEVTVALLGDGVFVPKDFLLENPPRLVIDLPGVTNQVRRRAVPVKSTLVSRVRVSQFQSLPDPVTRVVLDLARPLPHSLVSEGERLAVVVRAGEVAQAAAAAPSQTRIAETAASAAPPAPMPAPEDRLVRKEESPAAVKPEASVPVPAPEDKLVRKEESPPAVKPEPPAPAQDTPLKPAPESPGTAAVAPAAVETASASAPTSPAVPQASSPQPAPVRESPASEGAATLPQGVRKAQKSAAAPPPARPPREKPSAREEAVFEAAAAMLAQEEGARPEQPSGTYQPRTIAESQSQFTGEPISLDLKDADIKDVFRTISQLTQLNIVVDPEVRGTVTVQLEDVPWDQALDLILKQNGLGYVLENNIMRIATTTKLQAEQSDRARLSEARQAAEPTRTVIKKLSYAKASELTPVIKSVMSRRGDIVVDTRTNTLIIREIPTYLSGVLQLIENLDTATPQVMIEARIVETTKSLGRSLGIAWGATADADVAHGNTTNLNFPNTINGTFTVPLGTPQTIATLRLGNILGSFTLDAALSAAENQGLLKIISSPKVAALTNTAASIQSGVQIPVQTNVNNTTTVIYVDATLKLTVTPQITNEGTIHMTVNVSKREPAVALNLSIGQNVPLTVREYRGEILVRDGGTSVIGGIFQINDQDQNNMIPGLWKIPILGNLFRNKTRTEKHDELLIFITPRILRQ